MTSICSVLRALSRRHRLPLGHQRSPWTSLWRQPVSMAMRMPWPVFFLGITGLYLTEVAIFSLAFQRDSRHLVSDGRIFADLVTEDATGRRLVNLDALDRTRTLRSQSC